METQAQLWNLITAAGIHVRRAPDSARGWEYAIPAVHCDWYGPYPTGAEAIAGAAVRRCRRTARHAHQRRRLRTRPS